MNPEDPLHREAVNIIINAPLAYPKFFISPYGPIAAAKDDGGREVDQDMVVVHYWPERSSKFPILRLTVIDGVTGTPKQRASGEANGENASKVSALAFKNAFEYGVSTRETINVISKELKKPKSGQACFLAADINLDGNLTIHQAGDVALLVVRGEEIVYQTHDERNKEGHITNHIRMNSPTKNIFQLNEGDRIIIASDFLKDNFPLDEILVASSGKSPEDMIKTLDILKMRKKPDNRAIIVYDVEGLLEEVTLEADSDATEPSF